MTHCIPHYFECMNAENAKRPDNSSLALESTREILVRRTRVVYPIRLVFHSPAVGAAKRFDNLSEVSVYVS
jgi:hypothetical protein